ncbi:MAG: NADH-quinone oxidoreductase subunit N [Bacteroidia bacterium]
MKPILVLTGLGILTLLAELFRFRKALFPLVILGLLGALAATFSYIWFDDGFMGQYINGMLRFGSTEAVSFPMITSAIIIITALLWFLMQKDFLSDESNVTDHTSLIIFMLVGAVILTCFSNLTMLFLGVEILSIPLYVMAGSRKNDLYSNESAFKYFLTGSFASGFLLFGITLIYGAVGSFDLNVIGDSVVANAATQPGILYAGIILLLVGMLFKVSAAPFHFWAPDVYQGAPTPVTALMSTVVKTAAIVAISNLFLSKALGPLDEFWAPVLGVCAALTMVVGNVSAVLQTSTKRMLAFSSISHAGFLILAVAAISSRIAPKAVFFYAAAYSFASITVFTVLLNVIKAYGNDTVDSFNGLAKKNPLLAVTMTIALLSLAGIPPTAGFFGKYYVFTAAFTSGFGWLAVIGILASLVGVYYYFRIIIAMYFRPADETAVTSSNIHQVLLFITSVLTIVLGLLPDLLLNVTSLVENK